MDISVGSEMLLMTPVNEEAEGWKNADTRPGRSNGIIHVDYTDGSIYVEFSHADNGQRRDKKRRKMQTLLEAPACS